MEKETKQMLDELEKLYDKLISSYTETDMDIVKHIVSLEIEVEKECGQ